MPDPIIDNPGPVVPAPTQAALAEALERELDQAFVEAMISTDVRTKLMALVKAIVAKYLPLA